MLAGNIVDLLFMYQLVSSLSDKNNSKILSPVKKNDAHYITHDNQVNYPYISTFQSFQSCILF